VCPCISVHSWHNIDSVSQTHRGVEGNISEMDMQEVFENTKGQFTTEVTYMTYKHGLYHEFYELAFWDNKSKTWCF
jgi:hypothetical protein